MDGSTTMFRKGGRRRGEETGQLHMLRGKPLKTPTFPGSERQLISDRRNACFK